MLDRGLFLFVAGFLVYRCCDFIALRHKLRQTMIREDQKALRVETTYSRSLLGTVCAWLNDRSVMIGMVALLFFFSIFGFADLRAAGSRRTGGEQQVLSAVTIVASIGISFVGALVEALRLEQEES